MHTYVRTYMHTYVHVIIKAMSLKSRLTQTTQKSHVQLVRCASFHWPPAGSYPIVINGVRNNLSPGAHVLSLSVGDDLGYSADTSVNYQLLENGLPSNGIRAPLEA